MSEVRLHREIKDAEIDIWIEGSRYEEIADLAHDIKSALDNLEDDDS